MMNRWQTILAIDSDRWAALTYAANFPGVDVRQGYVRDYIDQMPGADVVIGGPPCQAFSRAGKRKGRDDERNGWPDAIAAVRRVRPRMFLFENVAGMLDAKQIGYFREVVAELEGCGYRVDVKELDAVNFGAPQFRNRVWVWGIRSDVKARHQWPKPTHAWPPPEGCMFGAALLPAVTVGEALGLDASIRRQRGSGVVRRDHPSEEPCPTVMQPTGGKSGLMIVGGGANPRHPGGIRTERDITGEPSTTIPAQHTHNAVPAVHEYRWSDAMLQKHPPASPASPAPTVQAKWFKGGAEGLLLDTKQHRTLQPIAEPSTTLAPDDRRALKSGKGIFIRRLTPHECARLQSLPDDFAWPPGITKTAMYRIVGNGWSAVMGRAFAEAFAAADPESRTIIDLFCGGGCGAVGWHGRFWSLEKD